MNIQLENEYPIRKWKSNLKMEIIVHLEIGKKVHKNNENWGMRRKKKVVCKTARRAHSQKIKDKKYGPVWTSTWMFCAPIALFGQVA